MRPDFGCAIHDFVFAPADAATAGQIAYEVRGALDRWEPRITVLDVLVTADAADTGDAAHRDPLRAPRHQRPAQPRLPLLRDPRTRRADEGGPT